MDGSAPPADTFLPTLRANLGSAVIGSWFMVSLFGVSCAQIYHYHSEYPRDSLSLKSFVAAFWLIDTTHTLFSCACAYYYLVSSAFDVEAIAMTTWYTTAALTSRIIIALLYLSYFTKLAFQLSTVRYRYIVAIILVVFTLAHACVAFVTVTKIHHMTLVADLKFLRGWMISMATTQVTADVALSAVLCVILQRHKTTFRRTQLMINTLMVFAVSRGLVTAITASVEVVAIATNPSLSVQWYSAAEYTIGALYTNSLLLTLNARHNVRGSGEESMVQLSQSIRLSDRASRPRPETAYRVSSEHDRSTKVAPSMMSEDGHMDTKVITAV